MAKVMSQVKKKATSKRRCAVMKIVLTAIVIGIAVLLGVSSCATVPTEALTEGEVRLLSLQVPEGGTFRLGMTYDVNITFEAEGSPEIRRACFSWSGDGPYCSKVNDVKYGLTRGNFTVRVTAPSLSGSYYLECYAEYSRGRGTVRTNAVSSHVYSMR